MRLILIATLFLTACVGQQEANLKFSSDEAACMRDKQRGVLRTEVEYVECVNIARRLYFQSQNPLWLRTPYEDENISQYLGERLQTARAVDTKKITESEATARYAQAEKNLETRHTKYLDRLEQERKHSEAQRQEREHYVQACIRSYEASMPKKYNTRCDGSIARDGGSMHGYQNCETIEERNYAPRYVVDDCYNKAKSLVQ